MSKSSPYIKEHSWGEIVVQKNEESNTYRDAKLFPGGSREWDWNETGTHHSPGIQPADVEELIDHGAEVIVLSRGVYERLQVCDETIDWLQDLNIPFHVEDTKAAIQTYNKLREDHKVGGLFHSTC